MKNKNAIPAILIGCNFISMFLSILFYFFCINNQYSWYIFVGSVLLFVVDILIIILGQIEKKILSPSGFFILSVVIFIMSRPLISLFFDVDIVQVGKLITDINITKTICVVSLGVNAFIMLFILKFDYRYLNAFLFNKTPHVKGAPLQLIFFCATCVMVYFLYMSYVASQRIGASDYFSLVDDAEFSAHIKWFFIAKAMLIVLLLLSSSGGADHVLKSSILLFIGSIGFIMIGLRGYTISYFFVFLYFYSERKNINLLWLVVIASLLLYLSAVVLEYRLGLSVFKNNLEMLYMPIYQQGASFEVVFGAVNFLDKLKVCISFESFISGGDFGSCVDKVRGVPFVVGGFASSFFAESYYFGWVIYLFSFAFLGWFIRYLDYLCFIRRKMLKACGNLNAQITAKIGFLLFCLIPNIVYFARSGAIDLPIKIITTSLALMIYRLVANNLSKAN